MYRLGLTSNLNEYYIKYEDYQRVEKALRKLKAIDENEPISKFNSPPRSFMSPLDSEFITDIRLIMNNIINNF